MIKKYFFFALLAFLEVWCFSQAYAEPGVVPVKGLKLIPVIGLVYKYDNNVLSSGLNKKSSTVSVLDGGVSAQLKKNSSDYQLDYNATKAVVYSSKADGYLDQLVRLKVNLVLTKRLDAQVIVNYVHSHDVKGATVTRFAVDSLEPDKWVESRAQVTVGYGVYGRVELAGDVVRRRYLNNRNRTDVNDLDTMGVGLLLSYPVGININAVGEAHYKKFDYKVNSVLNFRDNIAMEYLIGLNWEDVVNTHGEVRGGYLKKDFSSNQSPANNFNWDVMVAWDPNDFSRYRVNGRSTVDETNGFGDFVKEKGVSVFWSYDWTPFFSHTVEVSYAMNKFVGQRVNRLDKIVGMNVDLKYQIFRWLALSSDYQYSDRISSVVNGSYTKNVFSVGILGMM